ncbi:hypothetical protein FXO38_13385 [Capsicum annuum]|uniref:Uncharacterized protein n=1 Tax=Capsicum annuum TaxID=4072 RepID=A0A2G2YKF2_CAPAN|nr:hypothetical protein FXO38_13385 [Capsicum annuum]KAF3679767.1 hypothetical protein FXO37_03682 [Capsicum annuum]PHT70214.1 hypothetical protein T459_25318 [Capsicum annuum]
MKYIEDFCRTLPDDSQDLTLSQEQNKRIWLDVIGGLSRYGYAYGLPQQIFREFYSELKCLSNSQDDESREMILTLKQQITKLSNEAKASHVKKRQNDIQYCGNERPIDTLLASGDSPLSW